MPWGSWVNELPTEFFMVVHIAAFAVGATFASAAFDRPGTYHYVSTLHRQDMDGEVVVR